MTYQKNPEMFQAIAKYFAGWKNVKFLWIGGGEREDAFCTENLSATGWVNQFQVAEIMASADIYIDFSLGRTAYICAGSNVFGDAAIIVRLRRKLRLRKRKRILVSVI